MNCRREEEIFIEVIDRVREAQEEIKKIPYKRK